MKGNFFRPFKNRKLFICCIDNRSYKKRLKIIEIKVIGRVNTSKVESVSILQEVKLLIFDSFFILDYYVSRKVSWLFRK